MTEFGYIRVSAGVPIVKIADVDHNVDRIIEMIRDAYQQGVDIMVLPELCVTGYTCGDLFNQPLLLDKAEKGIEKITVLSSTLPVAFAVGCPVAVSGRSYNCAIMISGGRILGIVPKCHILNYGKFYEKRWFRSGKDVKGKTIRFAGMEVAFGSDLLFEIKGVKVGIEICEDLWTPCPPSVSQALAGADVILNLSASDELIGKHEYLRRLISQQSARCRCAYVYASTGWGESSTDLVFAGNAIVAEDGSLTEQDKRFSILPAMTVKDVDIEKLRNDRSRYSTFYDCPESSVAEYRIISDGVYERESCGLPNDLKVERFPFVPDDGKKLNKHCEEIINIQAWGLMQRLNAIRCEKAIIGISGGLDSTLALLVTVRAFDNLGLDRKGIIGITMPGMATTTRTHNNAVDLMHGLGVLALEIPIGKAVAQHFSDIGQDPDKYDVTYENSQARERTQILMDYANKVNGIVVGTGDLSELALGWCTYNGDQMSMYGVNASIPKTLVRHLVRWFAGEFDKSISTTLLDIVDTPISPELVPSGKDTISQKTEDLVGPYELHDFFIYHCLRNSFSPRKIFYLAKRAFKDKYDDATLLKWLGNFYRRFFNQQFKRSCMPDGPKVGSVCLSPRGDWRMPSDASSKLWLDEVAEMKGNTIHNN